MAKPFPSSVIVQAWRRSAGKCECRMTTCGHAVPHGKQLKMQDRGDDRSQSGWDVQYIDANAGPVIENCAIVCVDCHENASIPLEKLPTEAGGVKSEK